MFVAAAAGCQGKIDANIDATGCDGHDAKKIRCAVEVFQARGDIAEPDAGVALEIPTGREADAIIAHAQMQHRPVAGSGDVDVAAGGPGDDAVSNGIFDQRLQQKTGDHDIERVVAGIHRDGDASFEAGGFNGQIVVEEGEFFGEGDEGPRTKSERGAEKIAEAFHQAAGGGRIGFGEGADSVERVKEEVRMNLGAEGLQLSFGETALELSGFEREIAGLLFALADLRGVIARDGQAGDDGVDQEIPIEAIDKEAGEAAHGRDAADLPGGETDHDGQTCPSDTDRHMPGDALGEGAIPAEPAIQSDDEGSQQAPGIPAGQAVRQRDAPGRTSKADLAGEENSERGPEQEGDDGGQDFLANGVAR